MLKEIVTVAETVYNNPKSFEFAQEIDPEIKDKNDLIRRMLMDNIAYWMADGVEKDRERVKFILINDDDTLILRRYIETFPTMFEAEILTCTTMDNRIFIVGDKGKIHIVEGNPEIRNFFEL